MRIVQLLPALNEGGVERGVVELSREFVRRGVESVVISRGGGLVEQIERQGGQHVTLDVASKNPLTVPWRILQLRRALRHLHPSIVHARSRVPAWLCVLANRRPRFPFVTTVHGLNSVNDYSRVMTFGDRVICVSEVVSAYVQRHYGIDPGRITVIQRGVDLGLFDPARTDPAFIAQFKTKHRLDGRKIILSVGRVTWLKDYESFIDAIAKVRETRPDVIGVIVGGVAPDKQRFFEELKARVDRLGLSGHLVFAGSHSQMPEIYSLADVLVNASLKMGNMGRTVAEALAMNTPVLATTEKGLRNLVVDGVNGFVIKTRDPADLADKMLRALALPREGIRPTVPREYTL
ncbi:MAG: glycosyltransferase family 4 protein, partial [Verrucomicrobiae bacterium]|nr:glycosyltransferase family 4 protein [Verrucomicrobiae bacterium]